MPAVRPAVRKRLRVRLEGAVQGVGLRAPLSIPDATVAVVGPSPLPFTEATLSLEPR